MHPTVRTLIKRLAGLALAVAVAWPAAALQPFPADGTTLTEIEILGTKRTDAARIRAVMELKAGQPFRAESQRRDLQAIADLGSYNPLTIGMSSEETTDGVKLVVRVEENPAVGRISVVGNVKFTAERLLREIDFKEGDLLPLAAKSKTARSLREFYAKGGYKSTDVRVAIEPADDPETVNVSIVVDEGEKLRIKDLKVTGNSHYSDFRIGTSVMNSGSWLFFRNYYDDSAFEDDLRTVEAMYARAGYLDATARRGQFEYDQQKAEVTPEIVVVEGPRYKVAGVEISGNYLFNDEEVHEPFEPLVGHHFEGARFAQAIGKVKALYGNQGYVDCEIAEDFVKDPAAGTVVLKLGITENEVVYVGEIVVKKNTYDYDVDLNSLEKFVDWTSPGVKDETILQEVKLEPGEKFRTADEVRTEQRLRNLGIFKKVDIERRPTADPQVNDAVVNVQQDPNAGYIGATAGVGEISGFAVGLNYVNPDLFGKARVLKAGATFGSRVRSFRLGYLDRHFADSDNSLELEAYRDAVRYPAIGFRSYGGSVEYGIPLSEFNKVYVRTRGEHVNMYGDPDDLRENLDSYYVGAVRGMFTRDLRNDRRWTTRGYVASGGVETGAAREFMAKFLTEFEWYRNLDEREDWVYRFRNTFGVQPYDADHVGFSERFFIGGRTTLRGFKVHGVGPVDEQEDRAFTGGSTSWTQSHELRRRFTSFLAGRVFVDGGMLNEQPMEFGTFRASTGAGVSFDLGAFIVDVDLGVPIVRRNEDKRQFFTFSVRSSF